jgi:hypothetical protein
MGREGSACISRVLNCLIRRKIKRWKKSKIRKEGERGILREARRGRELVTWRDVGRRMEERSNLTSGFLNRRCKLLYYIITHRRLM